jgi:hypothetical protein
LLQGFAMPQKKRPPRRGRMQLARRASRFSGAS